MPEQEEFLLLHHTDQMLFSQAIWPNSQTQDHPGTVPRLVGGSWETHPWLKIQEHARKTELRIIVSCTIWKMKINAEKSTVNSNSFNKDRIWSCTCITLPHSFHCDPGPGSNKALFTKASPQLAGQSLPFDFYKCCTQILFIFLTPFKFCAWGKSLTLLNLVPPCEGCDCLSDNPSL